MARILIVEDEMLIAMLLEDIVSDLGHQPVGPEMRLESALIAVEHDIPFIFASGYGQAGLPQR